MRLKTRGHLKTHVDTPLFWPFYVRHVSSNKNFRLILSSSFVHIKENTLQYSYNKKIPNDTVTSTLTKYFTFTATKYYEIFGYHHAQDF